jgi:hypothetical protein
MSEPFIFVSSERATNKKQAFRLFRTAGLQARDPMRARPQ